MDQTAERELARLARVHPAEGLVPPPLWLVLFVIFGVILAYMLFFADPAEGAVTQGMLMGSVTVIISMLLLLLIYFDIRTAPGSDSCDRPRWNAPCVSSTPSWRSPGWS